ncbi:MAG TPA: valine--tRNA ligase [Rhabdochlamydiaceae bacterium]|nr:valine--tRNA ligase [Rhabdochlamydiaceae bacterium]
MSEQSKSYDPKLVEEKWYSFWESNDFFKADNKSPKPAYCISIPPPNVTSVLHIGHALDDTLQDTLIRFKRMKGYEALWVPGTDHAGIATQTVVERDLIAKKGKRRKDFSREEFIKICWEWKEEREKGILYQLKKLGCSCDWSRLSFTMDEKRSKAVKTVFKKMFDEKLIYLGDYLVNWDPVTQTALADDEVEFEEKDSFLWSIKYPLEDHSGFATIATTRPETMLGDVAIAVNPEDERYKSLIGKKAILPFLHRHIPILADPFVDPAFGTGMVKITPAHDTNDYEMARRHNLPMINIMTPDGKINENGLEFQGLTMEEARVDIVEKLKALQLIDKIEKHTKRVGVSYRSKAVIEPYLSKQWFVRLSSFKDELKRAITEKKVKMIPSHWESTYFHWIENLRDWCISRQLWWGHRIPIWYNIDDPEKMICYSGDDLPPEVKAEPGKWRQDEDVLDTWFSSSLWPFSILGWPENTPDLKKFYSNATLVPLYDILFFWVARMILMGEYVLDQVPFHETFIHGLIFGKSYWRTHKDGSISYITGKEKMELDLGKSPAGDVQSKWEKMSKSKGNIIDPIEIIETYGTDAMRLGLLSCGSQARQIDLDRRRFEEYRNFINKIWNGARFVFMNIDSLSPESFAEGINPNLLTLEDRWILSRLNKTAEEINQHLDSYTFDLATLQAYRFFWDEFCAYYLELVKPTLFGKVGSPEEKENKQRILTILLCQTLRLIHPMAPFITEELFQQLKAKFGKVPQTKEPYTSESIKALQAPACIVAPYPQITSPKDIDPEIEKTFSFMNELVHAIRNIRAEMQLAPNMTNELFIIGKMTDPHMHLAKNHSPILTALTRTGKVHFEEQEKAQGFNASSIIGNLKLIIPLPEEMKEREKQRLQKEKEKLLREKTTASERLANQDFISRAPKELVEKFQLQLKQSEKELAELIKKLEQF